MTTRQRERREAVVGRQSTLDGDNIPSWCACDLRTAPPSLPGFGNASEEHRS